MHPAPVTFRSLAVPALPAAVLFGHAEGLSWDEALMVLAPIAVLAGVLLYANHRVQNRFGPRGEHDPADDPATGRSPTEPSEPAGRPGPSDPS